MTDTRSGADERTMLTGFLDHQRAKVHEKCTGLTDAGAAFAPLESSPLMTVGGVVNHLRWVEYDWLEHVFLARPDLGPWTDEEPDREFTLGARTPIAQVLADYAAQCTRNREIAASHDLAAPAQIPDPRTGIPDNLRWILAHLTEETARHLGHLDIIREKWDGATGY